MNTDDQGARLQAALEDALDRAGNGYHLDDLIWYAFPQTWPSTSGMVGGPGGSAITTLQTIAIFTDDQCHVYCHGQYVYSLDRRSGMKCVQNMNFPSASRHKKDQQN